MNFYALELHKFVIGELRTDGWKSEWRKDLERRMAEDALKPRPIVKREQIRARQEKKKYPRQHPNKFYFKRECSVCASPIRHDNKTGRCIKHKPERPQPLEKAYPCGCCDRLIRKSELGICKRCFIKYRRRIQQASVRVCAEGGCMNVLLKNCTLTRCRKHAKLERRAMEALRWRTNKALARAA